MVAKLTVRINFFLTRHYASSNINLLSNTGYLHMTLIQGCNTHGTENSACHNNHAAGPLIITESSTGICLVCPHIYFTNI